MESLRWLFGKLGSIPGYILKGLGLVLLALLLIYYPVGMLVANRIDDDSHFAAASTFDIEGGSHAIAISEALIDREVRKHRWVANSPFFYPSSALIRMPAFQKGIIASLSRFAIEFSDQLGRARGSSQADPDLEKAAGLLKYPPNVWVFDWPSSLLPTTPSEDQYLTAEESFKRYNERLAKGQATFDRRADNLMEALDRIANDMGSSSAAIDEQIHNGERKFIDTGAASQYYFVKGRMYGDMLLLRELKRDFTDIIKEKQLDKAWDNVVFSLAEGSEIGHFFIFNASPDSQFLPNHLAVQGFYLLRARTQLIEVTNILLK